MVLRWIIGSLVLFVINWWLIKVRKAHLFIYLLDSLKNNKNYINKQ